MPHDARQVDVDDEGRLAARAHDFEFGLEACHVAIIAQ
jgi:hypothetical protein